MQKQVLATKAETYHSQLLAEDPISRAGRDYLDRRKLGGVAPKYRLGIVADPLPGDEQHTARLVIPYLTLAGVRGLKYRCIQDHDCKEHGHPKYTQPHAQEQRLYNAPAYFGGHDVIGVAEGELDAISATEHLEVPTFGIPGASQWKKQGQYWQLVLRDFATILIFADGDEPGRQLANEVANDAGQGARVVMCDPGTDINSMVVANRGDELIKKAGL